MPRAILLAVTLLALAVLALVTPIGVPTPSAGAEPLLCPTDGGPASFAEWPLAGDASMEAGPVEDGYVVGIRLPGTLERGATATVSNLCPLSDVVLQVEARLDAPGQAGYAIHLRRRSDEERLTLLVDAERRLASLYLRVDDRPTVLWGWAPVEALRGGTAVDRFKARLVGSRVSLEVNDVPLFDLETGGPTRGTLWLGVVTWGAPTRAIFNNLSIAPAD